MAIKMLRVLGEFAAESVHVGFWIVLGITLVCAVNSIGLEKGFTAGDWKVLFEQGMRWSFGLYTVQLLMFAMRGRRSLEGASDE